MDSLSPEHLEDRQKMDAETRSIFDDIKLKLENFDGTVPPKTETPPQEADTPSSEEPEVPEEETPSDETEGEEGAPEEETETSEPPAETAPADDEEKKKYKEIYKALRKKRYQAMAEAEALKKERDELKGYLEKSIFIADGNRLEALSESLNQAKIEKKQAIDDSDPDALIAADIKIAQAVGEMDRLKKIQEERLKEINQKEEAKPKEPQHESPELTVQKEIVNDWISQYPVIDRKSPEFSKEVNDTVIHFTQNLDQYLLANNRPDLILTDHYFDILDNYMSGLMTPSPKAPEKKSPPVTKAALPVVGAVGRSSGGTGTTAQKSSRMTLSADEKEMARVLNISEKDLLRNKENYLQTVKER